MRLSLLTDLPVAHNEGQFTALLSRIGGTGIVLYGALVSMLLVFASLITCIVLHLSCRWMDFWNAVKPMILSTLPPSAHDESAPSQDTWVRVVSLLRYFLCRGIEHFARCTMDDG